MLVNIAKRKHTDEKNWNKKELNSHAYKVKSNYVSMIFIS